MQSGSGASLLNAVWKWSQSSKCSLELEPVFLNTAWKLSHSSKHSLELEPAF